MGKFGGKFLREKVAGNSCGKILLGIIVGKSFGKSLRENLCVKFLLENLAGNCAGNSCMKILQEIFAGNLAGKYCRTGSRGKSQLKKGSDCGIFSILNSVMGSQPIRIQLRKILQENLVEKSCWKFLQEILVGNS